METASFDGFIKTLLYIVVFFYIFKFVAKLLLPLVVKKVVEKATQNFQNQQQNRYQSNAQQPNKDEIIIDTTNAKTSKEKNKVGDYVDYEEID